MIKFPDDDRGKQKIYSNQHTLEYIADMLLSLQEIALKNNLRKLSVILEIAHDEANLVRSSVPPETTTAPPARRVALRDE
jgi:hypothetical protein